MKRYLLVSALAVCLGSAHAQDTYVYVSPKPNSILVSTRTNIVLRSSAAVDRPLLMSTVLAVEGSQSGPHPGRVALSDDGRTIVFDPDRPFTGNETVRVSMPAGVRTEGGGQLPEYSFSFTTMAQSAQVVPQPASGYADPSTSAAVALLPAPPITIDTVNNPSAGYIFLATWDRNAPQHVYGNYLFILDRNGKIVDSMRVNGAPFDFKIQPNGRLSYGLGNYSGITPGNSNLTHYVLDSTLAVVDSFQMKNGYLTDFHDFILMPNGHALLMSYHTVTYDMSLVVPGGNPEAQLVINVIQEQDAAKNVVFEWRDIDYIPITDTDLNPTDPRLNPSTLNAYDLDNDGNLLLSFRNHSDIMKVSRETGDILWRWGGLKNEFSFVGEHPENAPYYFSRQHNIRRLPNGNVSLFDNGEFHSPWYSRAAEYHLDEAGKTATLVSEYRYSPGNINAQAAGNAQLLPDGGWFVGYGILMPTSPVKKNIVEVHSDGSKAFELSLPANVIAYRASKQPWRELIETIQVSNAEVLGGNTYSFNKDGKTTGVSVKYTQLTADIYNNVSVTRVPYGPVKPEFIAEAPIIYPVSLLYAGAAIESHTSEFHIDASAFPEIKLPATVSLYVREFPGQGLFIEMPTQYDSAHNELIASTTKFGEIVFGRPDLQEGLAAPFLIEPSDKKRVLAGVPLVLKWTGRGLLQSFTVQVAEDSAFSTISLDSTLTQSFVEANNLLEGRKYYWRVRAHDANGAGNWSVMWSFVPEAPFIQLLSPNGGEALARGDTSIIRWETNIADSVRLDILQGGVALGLVGKTLANVNAFRWIIPTSLLPGTMYGIRITSIWNVSLFDSSDAEFSLTDPTAVAIGNQYGRMDFRLEQNYPNPFNPSTRIRYGIPNRTHILLTVFNTLGQQVAVLENGEREAGYYEIRFDASHLASGVYMYRLTAGSFVQTRKLLLLK